MCCSLHEILMHQHADKNVAKPNNKLQWEGLEHLCAFPDFGVPRASKWNYVKKCAETHGTYLGLTVIGDKKIMYSCSMQQGRESRSRGSRCSTCKRSTVGRGSIRSSLHYSDTFTILFHILLLKTHSAASIILHVNAPITFVIVCKEHYDPIDIYTPSACLIDSLFLGGGACSCSIGSSFTSGSPFICEHCEFIAASRLPWVLHQALARLDNVHTRQNTLDSMFPEKPT